MSVSVVNKGGGGPSSAEKVSYNNSASKLDAVNVQNAIDELASEKAEKTELADKAPMHIKSQTDITDGVTPLADNVLYLVY